MAVSASAYIRSKSRQTLSTECRSKHSSYRTYLTACFSASVMKRLLPMRRIGRAFRTLVELKDRPALATVVEQKRVTGQCRSGLLLLFVALAAVKVMIGRRACVRALRARSESSHRQEVATRRIANLSPGQPTTHHTSTWLS